MNIDKITTLAQCEEVIEYLIGRDEETAQLKQQINEKTAAFNDKIQQIKNLNVSQQVRNKVKDVKSVVEKLKEDIIAAERKLSCEPRFTRAIERVSSNKVVYDKTKFITELKTAFDSFCRLADLLNNQSAKSVPDDVIIKAAKGYAIIFDIHQNIDKLLDGQLREPKVKEHTILDAKKRMSQLQAEWNYELTKGEREAAELCPLIEDFVRRQEICIENAELSSDSRMVQNFKSALTLPLGIATSKQRKSPTLHLNLYNRTVNIPIRTCYDVALYGGSGNMLITYDERNEQNNDLYQIIESIIMKFILCYPAGLKNIAVIDNITVGSKFIPFMGVLRKCCSNQEFLFEKQDGKAVYCKPQEIKDGLEKITDTITDRMSTIGDDILSYNISNNNNAQSLTLVIIKDLDTFKDYNETVTDYLKFLLESGPKLGVYAVFVGEKESVSKYLGDKMECFSDTFRFNSKNGCLETDKVVIECCNGLSDILNQAFYDTIQNDIKGYSSAIDFLQFQKSIRKNQEDFSRTLSIPVGKSGSDSVSLDLTATDSGSHAVISGATGSGKTAFLHNMILSAAYNYSPEQLELWLFDLKQGAPEFYIYRNLKHVKFLSLNSQPQDILESLEYLVRVMDERAKLAQTVGASSIYEYNSKVNEKQKMRRIMVIIDEYQELTKMRSCQVILERLETIIRQGRSYGISLILGSQKSDSNFLNIYSQIIHKLVFLSGSSDNDEAAMRGLIEKYNLPRGNILKGTCIYQSKGQVTMRGAFVSDKEGVIRQLSNEKYKGSQLNVRILEELNVIPKSASMPIEEICDYNEKEGSMYINVGETSFSGETVQYKVDYKNTRVLLLGDSKRAQNIEYAFIRSFGSISNEETCCYYIDASDGVICDFINDYRNSLENKSVKFVDEAQDICDALSSLYNEYKRRTEMGKQVASLPPIEIIIHGADTLMDILNSVSRPSPNSADALDDTDAIDEDAFVKMAEAEFSRSVDYDSTMQQELSWSEMLKQMMSNRRLKMYFTVHIENAQDMDSCVEYLFGYGEKFKDAFVVPDNSGDDMQEVYANTYEFLRKLSEDARDYAEMYNKGSGQLDKNKLNYMVIVDENKPQKFLPYEYKD